MTNIPVHNVHLDGEWRLNVDDEINYINIFAEDVREYPAREYDTVNSEIEELKYKFDALLNSVNAVLLKLQECARREDLVDDMGGSLDEFIERFVVH